MNRIEAISPTTKAMFRAGFCAAVTTSVAEGVMLALRPDDKFPVVQELSVVYSLALAVFGTMEWAAARYPQKVITCCEWLNIGTAQQQEDV